MKYKVKDLLDVHNLASHLFLDCVSHSVDGTDVIHSITKQDGYDAETTEVDIKLTFNGMEVKIDPFLEQFEKQYDRITDKKAQEKFEEMFPKLDYEDFYELEEKVNEFVDEFRTKIRNKYRVVK